MEHAFDYAKLIIKGKEYVKYIFIPHRKSMLESGAQRGGGLGHAHPPPFISHLAMFLNKKGIAQRSDISHFKPVLAPCIDKNPVVMVTEFRLI